MRVITSDVEQWVDTMIKDELGLPLESPGALNAAAMTFVAFLAVGLLPVAPFIVHSWQAGDHFDPYKTSSMCTALAFFCIGAVKARYTMQSWWRTGLSTLAVGGAAAGLAYAVGALLHGLVQI